MGYRNVVLLRGIPGNPIPNSCFLLCQTTVICIWKNLKVSADFWHNVGRGLSEECIKEIQEKGYNISRNGFPLILRTANAG